MGPLVGSPSGGSLGRLPVRILGASLSRSAVSCAGVRGALAQWSGCSRWGWSGRTALGPGCLAASFHWSVGFPVVLGVASDAAGDG